MDKKTFSIGILSITALILFLASLFPARAAAEFSVKDIRGWQMITTTSQQGGDILYILDPDGRMIVLAYSPARKALEPIAGGDVSTYFNMGK